MPSLTSLYVTRNYLTIESIMKTPPVNTAKIKFRHIIIFLSFIFVVIIPSSFASWYLLEKAQKQFGSTVAFTVNTEDVSAAVDILGGLSALGSSGSKDSDILYEYILSRSLVEKVHKSLNLKKMFSKNFNSDPWYSLDPSSTIEDIVEYWSEMVTIVYDRKVGMIEITAKAFTAKDAKLITETILMESSKKINQLSDISREDTVKYAKQELNASIDRLRVSRLVLTKFRSQNKFIDPKTEFGVQTNLLSALLQDLSATIVENDMLGIFVKKNDPRKLQLQRKIAVLEARIEQERAKFSSDGYNDENYSKTMLEFESLSIDLEYAQQAYLAAMTSYDSAVIESQRQSRYLATYIDPTLAERAEYPKNWTILSILYLISVFVWLALVLIFYALRDRK